MDTTAATMRPAEAYLRNEQNPPVLYVRIYGERRKLFINRGRENIVGIIAKGKRKHGYIFSDWNSIENYLNWFKAIETVLKNEKNQTEALWKMSMMERNLNFATQ